MDRQGGNLRLIDLGCWPLSQATLVLSRGEVRHQLFLFLIMVEALIMATISWLAIERPSLQ